MKKIIWKILCSLVLTLSVVSAEENPYWKGAKDSVDLFLKGSYTQFTTKSNIYYLGVGGLSNWYAFENDDRVSRSYQKKDLPSYVDLIGNSGILMSFPVVHIGSFWWGQRTQNDKLQRFAKEYLASMYLALVESSILSRVSIHRRPSEDGVSFWETKFRGDSSYPSGHVIPFMTLFFKTFQFYGPYWSTLPLALTYFASYQRMQDRKHWFSDIVGAFFLSAMASEGVRKAAKYDGNHPFYKWIFERDITVGVTEYHGSFGPMITFSF